MILGIFIGITFRAVQIHAGDTESRIQELKEVMQELVDWKKSSLGQKATEPLISKQYAENAGTSYGDWYPLALARMGMKDDFVKYLEELEKAVTKRYQQTDKLDANKATEWHRIGLVIAALGGEPSDVGEKHINLVADGTYNRGKTAALGNQGINGYIWALLLLDCQEYEVPEDAYEDRKDMIVNILERQNADGGFSFTGVNSEVDITAMVLQALTPYQEEKKTYEYVLKHSGNSVTNTISQVIEKALGWLAQMQTDNGDFGASDTLSAESTAQVVIALSGLGIDVEQDQRFQKNGFSAIDGLMQYRMEDGGFAHSIVEGRKVSNSMAGEQVLCALISYVRQLEGKSALYDCTDVEPSKIQRNTDESNVLHYGLVAAGTILLVIICIPIMRKRKKKTT